MKKLIKKQQTGGNILYLLPGGPLTNKEKKLLSS